MAAAYVLNITLNNIEINPDYLKSGTFISLIFRCSNSPQHYETQSVSLSSKIELNYLMQFAIASSDLNSDYLFISLIAFKDSKPTPIGEIKTNIGRIPIDSTSNKNFSLSIMSTQKMTESAAKALFSGTILKTEPTINPNYANQVQQTMNNNYTPYQQQIPFMNGQSYQSFQASQQNPGFQSFPYQNMTSQMPMNQNPTANSNQQFTSSNLPIQQISTLQTSQNLSAQQQMNYSTNKTVKEYVVGGNRYYF